MEDVKYNIDELIIENGKLRIKGWIFCPYKEIDSLYIVFSGEGGETTVPVEDVYEREDVIIAFGEGAVLSSGFSFESTLPNMLCHKVSLQYECDEEINRIFLKQTHESLAGYLISHRELFTKENFLKVINYIKVKGLRNLIHKIRELNNKIETNDFCPTDFWIWTDKNFPHNEIRDKHDKFSYEADVIIPVYNGLEYLENLFKDINKTNVKLNIIVIDDKSNDERVVEYLNQLSASKQITLLRNSKNLGFVKSVNKGLRIAQKHVILLNTDTEVPPFWAERLLSPIIKNERVATVTPFTNSGTICSFPNIGVDNEIAFGFNVSSVDEIFQRITPRYTEIPTGVGFCMAMNKTAIEEVGFLDEEVFLRGYGEENDWCQRAIIKGYKNVICENLFVFHNHGGSFSSIEKKDLSEKGLSVIKQRYPKYLEEVAAFMRADSVKDIRQFVYWMIICKSSQKVTLRIDSNDEGLDKFEREFEDRLLVGDGVGIRLSYNRSNSFYLLEFQSEDARLKYSLESLDRIADLVILFGVEKILIKSLSGFPDIYSTLQKISDVKQRLSVEMITCIYDYFSICPSNFVADSRYCGKDFEKCAKCFEDVKLKPYIGASKWREIWGNILISSDSIITFSERVKDVLIKTYNLEKTILDMYEEDYFVKCAEKSKFSASINIGIIDYLNKSNGLLSIKGMLNVIEERHLNINIFLFDGCEENISHKNLKKINLKSQYEVQRLLIENDIDIIFQASIYPKDSCFKLQLAKAMGIPLAVYEFFDIASQTNEYSKVIAIRTVGSEQAVTKISEYFSNLDTFMLEKEIPKILFVIETEDFASRYRVEHLIERLNSQGVYCNCVLRRKIKSINLSGYTSVVFYRTPYGEDLKSFIESAKSQGCKIIFDVDDYVFDFKEISHLEFLQDREYHNFENYCNGIDLTMNCCDAIMTSTLALQSLIEQKYKMKQCIVNRNSVSTSMALLSKLAMSQISKDQDKVVLGYFSGSKTHKQDFEEISEVLVRLMKEKDNLYLKVVGCLNLPIEFECVKHRIIEIDFLAWTDLPKEIASVDINLLPLKNNNFTVCKSENKWVEAALVKVPTVLSYNAELSKVMINNQNAIICKEKEDWYTSLMSLIENPTLRECIASKANQCIMDNYISINRDTTIKEFLLNVNLDYRK